MCGWTVDEQVCQYVVIEDGALLAPLVDISKTPIVFSHFDRFECLPRRFEKLVDAFRAFLKLFLDFNSLPLFDFHCSNSNVWGSIYLFM